MRKLTKRVMVVFGLCLMMASLASADVQLYVNQADWSMMYDHNYVGPAGASFAPNGRWDFDIICNDYVPATYVPSNFSVRVTPLATAGSPETKFSDRLTYQRAAWLIDQMYAGDIHDSARVGQIQYAIWELFSPATPGDSATWLGLVPQNLDANYGFGRFEIYTPTSADNNGHQPVQEFMRRTSVPEPAMLGTLLFGLVGVGLFSRKRYKAV